MATVQCFICVFIVLLGLSTFVNGRPLQRTKNSVQHKNLTPIPQRCRLRHKTFGQKDVNWTRLVPDEDIVSILHNTSFTISYCSGRCLQHNTQTAGHVINDDYALQMRNLVKSCEDNNMNCEELSPCCVPKRYHGHNNRGKIEFKKTNVDVEYVNKNGHVKRISYKFLNPTVCHCQ